MASVAAAKVELDMLGGRVMFYVVCCREGEDFVCLLRFGVNGSFYLNTKKISLCSLVQNLTSLCASSVQAPRKLNARAMQKRCTCVWRNL